MRTKQFQLKLVISNNLLLKISVLLFSCMSHFNDVKKFWATPTEETSNPEIVIVYLRIPLHETTVSLSTPQWNASLSQQGNLCSLAGVLSQFTDTQ